ncbi:FeoC-like transcriptional regulator [Clostridium paraputrificum]|uniref:FeoC-like transcriptional regulator n=1 Tax=Clostridium TaxID=1485 RepID=UPI003D3378DC
MLINILDCLNKEGNFSTNFISNELNIPSSLVEDLKNRLINMGYISKVSCDTTMCEGCSCGCNSIKLNDKTDWNITEKGHEVLKKMGR